MNKRHFYIKYLFLLCLSCLWACKDNYIEKLSEKSQISSSHPEKKRVEPFQNLLDTVGVEGTILIFDQKKNAFYSNDFKKAMESDVPASTFKIPNSIIGLELGILEDENSMFTWNGEDRAYDMWEKDLTLQQAFQLSCVPCYQELARNIGATRMKEKVAELNYGDMDIHEENIDLFWLVGSSQINAFQQINFLKRFVNQQLPISKTTFNTVKSILKIKQTETYQLSGKTGLAVGGANDVGWYVGYVEKEQNVYYFATKISPKSTDVTRNQLMALRKSITMDALQYLKILVSK